MSKVTKRKHVTKELDEDLSVPAEKQFIVKLVTSRGNNLHEVTDRSGENFLVSMPVKFRRNIWIKRGDFVLVEPIPEGDKVKAEIAKILTKEHIKFYRTQNVWPKEFDNKSTENDVILSETRTKSDETTNNLSDAEENDLFINTNRQFEQYNSDNNKNTWVDSSSESD